MEDMFSKYGMGKGVNAIVPIEIEEEMGKLSEARDQLQLNAEIMLEQAQVGNKGLRVKSEESVDA